MVHSDPLQGRLAAIGWPAAFAVRNFLSQIWQPHIGAVTLNQILRSILACASEFRAPQVF
jgi:hypothetical protein